MIQIRRAEPADALAVADMHVRSWQIGYRGLLPQEHLDGLDVAARAARYTFDRTLPEGPVNAPRAIRRLGRRLDDGRTVPR